MELRFDRSLPGRGGNDQSRLHSVAAAIPIKGNRQNFMGQVLNDILTPDSRILDFSPMPLERAMESAKSPDEKGLTYDLSPMVEWGPGSENPVSECRTVSVCPQGT